MIPIPLWLTPQVIKGGIVGAIVLSIFFAGFFFKGKLDAAKIQRMKAKVTATAADRDRCLSNYDGLAEAVALANADIEKQNEEYNLMVVQLREMNSAAISHLNALHDESITGMIAEANQLREAMAEMSAEEACHAAMLEIVK